MTKLIEDMLKYVLIYFLKEIVQEYSHCFVLE